MNIDYADNEQYAYELACEVCSPNSPEFEDIYLEILESMEEKDNG